MFSMEGAYISSRMEMSMKAIMWMESVQVKVSPRNPQSSLLDRVIDCVPHFTVDAAFTNNYERIVFVGLVDDVGVSAWIVAKPDITAGASSQRGIVHRAGRAHAEQHTHRNCKNDYTFHKLIS